MSDRRTAVLSAEKLLEEAGYVIEHRTLVGFMDGDDSELEKLLDRLGVTTEAIAKYTLGQMVVNGRSVMECAALAAGITMGAALAGLRDGTIEPCDAADKAEVRKAQEKLLADKENGAGDDDDLSNYEGPVL